MPHPDDRSTRPTPIEDHVDDIHLFTEIAELSNTALQKATDMLATANMELTMLRESVFQQSAGDDRLTLIEAEVGMLRETCANLKEHLVAHMEYCRNLGRHIDCG